MANETHSPLILYLCMHLICMHELLTGISIVVGHIFSLTHAHPHNNTYFDWSLELTLRAILLCLRWLHACITQPQTVYQTIQSCMYFLSQKFNSLPNTLSRYLLIMYASIYRVSAANIKSEISFIIYVSMTSMWNYLLSVY